MKEQLLYDIILGFALLSLWLNLASGYLPSLIASWPEPIKLSLCYLAIILFPLFVDFTFNHSVNSSQTFSASILSSVMTLVTRELFVWWKDKHDIQKEIFSELLGNYKALLEWVELSGFLDYPKINLGPNFCKGVLSRWTSQVYDNNSAKLQAKRVYSQEVINDLRDVYKAMETAISEINKNNDGDFNRPEYLRTFLVSSDLGVLNQTKNLLIRLNEREAYKFPI